MKPVFRSAMFGFHRDDVANFIAKQSRQYEKKIAELEESINNERKEFEREKEILAQDRIALENLREKCSSYDENITLVRSLSSKITADGALFSDSADLCQTECEKLEEQFRITLDRLSLANSYKEKAEKFDQLASVLNNVISGQSNGTAPSVPQNTEAPVSTVEHFDGFEKHQEIFARIVEHMDEMIRILETMNFSE